MKPLATLAVLAAVAAQAAGPSEAPPGNVPRWEYRILAREEVHDLGKKDLAAGLNRLGAEGWELVAVDAGYIFKRPRPDVGPRVADVKVRIAQMESDVELVKERVAWAERMYRKGLLAENLVKAHREQLRRGEFVLDLARQELRALLPEPKVSEGKEKPEK